MPAAAHPLLKRIGQRVRQAREQQGWSQEALADAAGLDRSYMSGIERGVRNISVLKLAAVAKRLSAGAASTAGKGSDVVDLSAEMVALMEAKLAAGVNLKLVETANEMASKTIDVLG